jgi:transcription antitermination factor NusG
VSIHTDWYAIRVKANRETVTAQALKGKGFEVCLPVYEVESHKSRGVQILRVPLFAGYLFARFDLRNRLPVLTIPGVVKIVGFGKDAEPVDPQEMSAVLALVEAGAHVLPHPYLPLGQRIRVRTGPLRGVEGVVVEHKDTHRLVVSVTLLQRSIAVDVERHWVLPVVQSARA